MEHQYLKETVNLFLDELFNALKARCVEVVEFLADPELITPISPRGMLYLKVRPSGAGRCQDSDMVINLTNMIADILLVDRDRPELGFDPAIEWRAERQRKVRDVVSAWMAVLDALLVPDAEESRRRLESLGRQLPRLKVTEGKDGTVRTVMWFKDGQLVH